METFSTLLAICAGNSPVTGEFPTQRPVTRGFDVFFDLRLNKRLSKHSWGWWFETPSVPLWRHCNIKKWSSTILNQRNNLGPIWYKYVLQVTSIEILVIEIRRYRNRLIFIMGMIYWQDDVFILNRPPGLPFQHHKMPFHQNIKSFFSELLCMQHTYERMS